MSPSNPQMQEDEKTQTAGHYQGQAAFLIHLSWGHVLATSTCAPDGESSKIHGLLLYLLLTHWQLSSLVSVGFLCDS